MDNKPLGRARDRRDLQPKKAPCLMRSSPEGMLTVCKEMQLENVCFSMIFTAVDITTVLSAVHDSNAEDPIAVTELGIVIVINEEQRANAVLAMDETDDAIITVFNEVHPVNAPSKICVIEEGIVTEISVVHP
mmetsp:Transcript_24395/g.33452  ORF Transcript_24395/g.33452 Transcript_24395/m.33452 type:complete len:133 (-) Transcript_24395:1848-2246(-)